VSEAISLALLLLERTFGTRRMLQAKIYQPRHTLPTSIYLALNSINCEACSFPVESGSMADTEDPAQECSGIKLLTEIQGLTEAARLT
jgi:hypothetical protein